MLWDAIVFRDNRFPQFGGSQRHTQASKKRQESEIHSLRHAHTHTSSLSLSLSLSLCLCLSHAAAKQWWDCFLRGSSELQGQKRHLNLLRFLEKPFSLYFANSEKTDAPKPRTFKLGCSFPSTITFCFKLSPHEKEEPQTCQSAIIDPPKI